MTGPAALTGLIWQTIFLPATVGRALPALHPTRAVLFQALVLITILTVLQMSVFPSPVLTFGEPIEIDPMAYALFLGCTTTITAFLLQFIGQAMGGEGDLDAMLAIVVWSETVFLAEALVRALASLMLRGLLDQGLLYLAMALKFWVLAGLITGAHGFREAWRGPVVLVLAIVGMGFGVGVIITLIAGGAGDV